ncbi:hypothetical protein ABRP72_19490 [Pectobacterium carotovorum]|uniref:hypothetical protein n=1 Tax=Pectobacterium carotovorum TaxID=554 RepID=UPI0032F017C1
MADFLSQVSHHNASLVGKGRKLVRGLPDSAPAVLLLLLRHEDPQLFIHQEDTIMQQHHNGTAEDVLSHCVLSAEIQPDSG